MKSKELDKVDIITQMSTASPEKCSKLSTGVVLGIIVTMVGSALPAGHNLGVINMSQEIIRAWILSSLVTEYGVHLTLSEEYIIWGLTIALYLGGALVGSTSGAHLANSLGRRNGLLLVHVVFMISGIMIASCQYVNIVELLLLGRFVAGLSAGAATSLVPLYLSEIGPPAWRGVMGTLFPLGLCTGILISQIIGIPSLLGKESTWAYLVGGHLFYAAFALPFHWFILPSPTHLFLNKKNTTGALIALNKLRNGDIYTITQEQHDLTKASQDSEKKGAEGDFRKLFSDRKLFRSLVVVVVLNMGQQLVGINAIFYYSTIVFLNAGMSLEWSQGATLCAGIANLLMAALAMPLIRYFKRRNLLIVSVSLYCFWQVTLLLSLLYVTEYWWAGLVAVVSIFASVLSFGLGLGPVPYMIGTEIFPSDIRGLGLSLGGASNWGMNLVVGLMFPLMHESLGELTFAVGCGFGILILLFVIFIVPETFPTKKKRGTYILEEAMGSSPPFSTDSTPSQGSPLLFLSTTSSEEI